MLFDLILKRIVKTGSLTMIDPQGRSIHYGTPPDDNTIVARLHGALTPWRIALNPKLALGEAYMDGRLTLEQGSIYDFLTVIARNLGTQGQIPFTGVQQAYEKLLRMWHQFNPEATASSASAITTIWTDGFMICSSIPTNSIPAPISRRRTRPWNRRSWPRNGISRPS